MGEVYSKYEPTPDAPSEIGITLVQVPRALQDREWPTTSAIPKAWRIVRTRLALTFLRISLLMKAFKGQSANSMESCAQRPIAWREVNSSQQHEAR